MGRKLAAGWMALLRRRQRARRSMQDHHVVDEPWRDPEMPGGFPVAVAFFNKRNDTRTQLDRMRLAHGGSPSRGEVNHASAQTGIPNPVSCETL